MDDLKDDKGNSLCWKDCLDMKQVLERYSITDTGPNDLYIMNEENTMQKVVKVIVHIKKRFKKHPDKKFLIVYVLAGHGMQDSGQQIILLN